MQGRFIQPWHLVLVSFGILCFVSVQNFLYTALPWDGAVYIAMGKYIASGGTIGLWEWYRPPLLPLVFSIGELFGIAVVWAKGITVLSGFLSLWLIYLIGERFRRFAGGLVTLLFASSALLTDFLSTATTELPGVALFLGSLYFLLREKFFLTGLFAGFAFVLRFPYGIVSILYFLYLLIYHRSFRKMGAFMCGALLPVAAFLISNYVLYDDAIQPILEGLRVAQAVEHLYAAPGGYYVMILALSQPLLIFSILAFRQTMVKKEYLLLLYIAAAFMLYFSLEAHKEDRYIIPAAIPLVILAGVGLRSFYKALPERGRGIAAVAHGAIIALLICMPQHANFRTVKNGNEDIFKNIAAGAIVLSSDPFPAVYSDVKVIPAYDSWNVFSDKLRNHQNEIDHIFLNSCNLDACIGYNTEQCKVAKDAVQGILDKKIIITLKDKNNCEIVPIINPI